MTRKKKPGAAERPPGKVKSISRGDCTISESAANQRRRLLNYLRITGSCTTLEARQELDILHPGGRVYELRCPGAEILTAWTTVPSTSGRTHRVARYVLLPGGQVAS